MPGLVHLLKTFGHSPHQVAALKASALLNFYAAIW